MMTRLAVLADIHGNLTALETVLADLKSDAVQHIIVAGDAINWGPSSAAVMERIHGGGWAVLRGNNEYYLLDYQTPRQPEAWANYRLMPWLRDQLQGRWHDVIAAWPDALSLRYPDAPPLRVCHGTPLSPWEPIYPQAPQAEVEAVLNSVEEHTVLCAHTHLPMDRQVGRWHVLNPGSVGIPLEGRLVAQYMLLEGDADGWRATLREVPFDVGPVLDALRRSGMDSRMGVTGQLVMREFETATMWVYPFARWRRDHFPGQPESEAMLEQFTEAERFAYSPAPYQHAKKSAR